MRPYYISISNITCPSVNVRSFSWRQFHTPEINHIFISISQVNRKKEKVSNFVFTAIVAWFLYLTFYLIRFN